MTTGRAPVAVAPNLIACFLPADRCRAIARGEKLPDRTTGSALFADISGFTKLTEELVSRHGLKRGAEELTVRLNGAYDVLNAAVDRFRGSVIGFSGDAITCWFDGIDDPATAAGRAVAAAGAMRVGVASLATEGLPLGVKIAVASGPARRFAVGDPSIQLLDVLAGETPARTAACESVASVGEIVVDEATAALARDVVGDYEPRLVPETGTRAAALRGEPAPVDEAPWPALPPEVPEDQLRRYLPPGIDVTRGDQLVTELRLTVPIFVAFSGIDYDGDARAEEKLGGWVRHAQNVVARQGGAVLDITLGDKGSYLYANLGAVGSHEDDTRRAVTAALELRKPPPDLDFIRDVRIGLSRGTMRAGIVGGAGRRVYGVLGDEVNLAARLMQRAEPGEALVSGAVHESLDESFDRTPLAHIAVKGKSGLIPVYRLEGAGGDTGGGDERVPVVGRIAELELLGGQVAQLVAGEGSVVLIEGEAGIGKSRLVSELRAHAHDHGVATLVGAGDQVGRGAIFHGWRPTFATIFALEGDVAREDEAAAADVRAKIVELTGDVESAAYTPLLAPVLPLRLPDTAETAGLTGQIRADRRLTLLVDILRGVCAKGPTVIMLEDAHWLDTASWSLVSRVAHQVQPALLVLAMRPPDQPAPEHVQIAADPATVTIRLGALDDDGLLEVARRRIGADDLPPEVAALILERAEGNPFFSEELASALRDGGVIEVADGACRVVATTAELRRLDLPDTVQGVITSRIDRLTDAQKMAIKVASVIGRTFQVRPLEEIHPIPDYVPQLHDDLAVLADLELTPLVSVEPEPTYMFKHVITQEVAYTTLLFSQRAQLHRGVAGWFERAYAVNLAPHYATLAHHWRRALEGDEDNQEVVERALDYGVRAGEQALRNNAHVEATDEFRQVIGLLANRPGGPERDRRELHAQTMLGYSLMNQRGYGDDDVEAAYRRARELTAKSGAQRSAELGPPLYGLLSYYASRGEYAPAAEVANELLALGEELGDPHVRLIGHNSIGIVSTLTGDLSTGRSHTELSHRLADEHQDQELMLRYGGDFRGYPRAWLSTAQCLLGYPDQAQRTFEETLELTRDHPYTFGFMLTFGITPILLADLERTVRYADELTEVAQRYGFVLLLLVANIHKGWALGCRGESEGVDLIAGSLPVIKAVKLDSFLPMYLGLHAEALLANGRLDEAAASLDEADTYVRTAGASFYAPELMRIRGSLQALTGDAEGAAASFTAAIGLAKEQGARWWELRAGVALAELDQPEAKQTAARAVLAELLETFDEGDGTADVLAARTAVDSPNSDPRPQEV